MKLPMSAVTSSSAPNEASATWTYTTAAYYTAKTAHQLTSTDSSNVVILLQKSDAQAKMAAAVMLTSSGAVSWGPTDYGAVLGEGTDMQPTTDGTNFVITGLGQSSTETSSTSNPGTYYARIGKYSSSDGSTTFTKGFSACGNPADSLCNAQLQYQECWGVTMDSDGGYVVACGTGIENCDTSSTRTADTITDCTNGQADKRSGAYKRAAGKWALLTFKTDSAGTLLWQRVDSYETQSRTTSTLASSSSAGEFVVKTSDGGFAIFTDEETGFGIMKLAAAGTTTTSTPTASPTSAANSAGSVASSMAPMLVSLLLAILAC